MAETEIQIKAEEEKGQGLGENPNNNSAENGGDSQEKNGQTVLDGEEGNKKPEGEIIESDEHEESDSQDALKAILQDNSQEQSNVTEIQAENERLKAENKELSNRLHQLQTYLEHPTVQATVELISENPDVSTDKALKVLIKSDPRNMSSAELYAEKQRAYYASKLSGEDLEYKVASRLRDFEDKEEDEQEEDIAAYKQQRIEQYIQKSKEFLGKKVEQIEESRKQQEAQKNEYDYLINGLEKVKKVGKIGTIELEADWGQKIAELLQNGIFKRDEKGNLDLADAIDTLDYAANKVARKKMFRALGGKQVTIQKIEQHAAKEEVKAEQKIVGKLTSSDLILDAAKREAEKNSKKL